MLWDVDLRASVVSWWLTWLALMAIIDMTLVTWFDGSEILVLLAFWSWSGPWRNLDNTALVATVLDTSEGEALIFAFTGPRVTDRLLNVIVKTHCAA